MRVSRDIFRLLVNKYFTLETLYQCQFVSQWVRSCLSPQQISDARMEHAKIIVRRAHAKEYDRERKMAIKDALVNVPCENKKAVARELMQTIQCCDLCHNFYFGLDHKECHASYNRACKHCGCEYYAVESLYHSEHYRLCPRTYITCSEMQHLRNGSYISSKVFQPCEFFGPYRIVRQHVYARACQRKCTTCEKVILFKNFVKHVKTCAGIEDIPMSPRMNTRTSVSTKYTF